MVAKHLFLDANVMVFSVVLQQFREDGGGFEDVSTKLRRNFGLDFRGTFGPAPVSMYNQARADCGTDLFLFSLAVNPYFCDGATD